ncbi:MAG: tetratricopeptide repeat protein [Cyanobacteria bacterium J06581_3]
MTAENPINDRNVHIQGNTDKSTIVTGDGNTVNHGTIYQTVLASDIKSTVGSESLSPPYFFPDTLTGSIFVGRESELESLHDLLQQGDRVAIAAVGMGGIGKTTLARWYVKQHRADYPGGIWWLPAAQLVTQALAYAGRSIGLEELPTDWQNEQIVQHYLARWEAQWPRRKLLVLDDVGEYKRVKNFLPQQGAFRVLMTTRVRMQSPVKRLQLGVLEPAAALALLRELLGEDARLEQEPEVAAALCKWLGYLPLGIELIGRYLSESRATLAAVFAQLKSRALGARMISTVPDEMDYEHNIEAALELSWQTLNEQGQMVALLLGVFALAPISAEWVVASLPSWNELDVRDCLDGQLVKRSLVNQMPDGYELHGLVREFLQAELASPVWEEQTAPLSQGFAEAMTAIAKTIPQTATLSDRARVLMAVPHLEAVAAQWTAVLDDDDKTWCCDGLARFYQSMSRWAEAERCCQRSLEISKAKLSDRHPDTARSLNNLALLYKSQGRYGEVEPLLIEALEISKAELGGQHPDTALSLNNLALLYESQGRYGEAEPLLIGALKIRTAELGYRHLDTARSLNNLAALYYSTNRLSEAAMTMSGVVSIFEELLGPNHPNTITMKGNLDAIRQALSKQESQKN